MIVLFYKSRTSLTTFFIFNYLSRDAFLCLELMYGSCIIVIGLIAQFKVIIHDIVDIVILMTPLE